MAISRDRLGQYEEGLNRLVELAQAEVRAVYDAFLPLGDAELMRDAMVDSVEAVSAKYGDMAATLAAELFEELGEAEAGRSFDALLSDTCDPAQLERSVRYSARHLFGGEWMAFLGYLNGVVDKAVKRPARDTIMDNAARHADSGVRFARIPKGPTCPFCVMLASRGFVYHSADDAGELGQYHPKCDCQVVPSWERSPRVEGYDPDGMYERYASCRRVCGSGDAKDVLAEMATRDRRWLYDGTAPRAVYEKPRESLEKHERQGVDHLLRNGIVPTVKVEDPKAKANIDFEINGDLWEMKNVSNAESSVSNQVKRARVKWFKLGIDEPMRCVITCEGCSDSFGAVCAALEKRRRVGEEFLILSSTGELRKLA